jgi:hypothetical protein
MSDVQTQMFLRNSIPFLWDTTLLQCVSDYLISEQHHIVFLKGRNNKGDFFYDQLPFEYVDTSLPWNIGIRWARMQRNISEGTVTAETSNLRAEGIP